MNTQPDATPPLQSWITEPTARRVLVALFFLLALGETFYALRIGNQPGEYTDPHSEADAIRSTEAYFKDGLWSHHGLPRILHGDSFTNIGTIVDHLDEQGKVLEKYRQGFPAGQEDRNSWVYTHYPPGPNLICALYGRLFGLSNIWKWRLAAVAINLALMALAAWAFIHALGAGAAAFLMIALAAVPRVAAYLPGLHYEGYSQSLLILQMSLLCLRYWRPARWHPSWWIVVFLLGFLQGWLSFDQFFLVSFVALPLWWMRRSEGQDPGFRPLLLSIGLPLAGFGLAHFAHLLQVAAELGGLLPALNEFRNTAVERGAQGADQSYWRHVGEALRLYLREVLKPVNRQFGPLVMCAAVAAVPVLMFRSTRVGWCRWAGGKIAGLELSWPGNRGIIKANLAALAVSLLWLLVMPQHSVGNFHLTVGHLVVLYFCLLLTILKSARPVESDRLEGLLR